MNKHFNDDEIITQEGEEEISFTGEVISIKDGIAFVSGLENLKVGELVEFSEKNIYGVALNLETDQVGCIVLGNESSISQGDSVLPTDRLVTVPVGDHLLGRVVNGLGQFIDGKEETDGKGLGLILKEKHQVYYASFCFRTLLTGYKIVDSLLPIGRGQRELIIGDRQTVKPLWRLTLFLHKNFIMIAQQVKIQILMLLLFM